jgi:eukaryotic-like serine/threonine-protein kinase
VSSDLAQLSAALEGRYAIVRELGQGGMATVYLAEDLKHARRVALKVLKPELAAVLGADRFVVEIRTTAALQHPHILPLFDSGEAGGFLYYVMPFIDGETLRSRLDRETQLGIDESVRVATAVADALDYAHRQGVIHRDIKPENILLQEGRPMVADFGIALAVSAAAGGRMTETGLSLGTPHYMSPEQATAAKEITGRSDIYSLASVLYEMLTGEPPHTGASAQQIIMKIVTEEASPVTRLRRSVPPNVAAAVARALEKLPADRFDSARAFADALADQGFSGVRTRLAPGARARRSRSGLIAAAAPWAIAAVAVAIAGWASWRGESQRPPAVIRSSVTVPDSVAFDGGLGNAFAVAPGGVGFVYHSRLGLMWRAGDRLDVQPIAGGRHGSQPFFSPDGEWLAFRREAALLKVSMRGGAPVAVCDSCPGYNYNWDFDDTIRYHTTPPGNPLGRVLAAVAATGGKPRVFAAPDTGSGELYRSPQLLPGGRTILFNLFDQQTARVALLDRRSGRVTRFDITGVYPRWVEGGWIVLGSREGVISAIPFDLAKLRPTGAPITLAADVRADLTTVAADVSTDGTIIYAQAGEVSDRRLLAVSRSGQPVDVGGEARAYAFPRYSPDGRRIAVGITSRSGDRDVWILDVAQRALSRTTNQRIAGWPAWTPDGRFVLYSQNADIWRVAADGSGSPEALLEAVGSRFPGNTTPDGATLVFQEDGSGSDGLRLLALDSTRAARTIIPSAFREGAPALSADGRWLAYQSDQSGRTEIYVRPFPQLGARVQVSLQGGAAPAWSRDGRELFYRTADSMVVATFTTDPAFTVTGRRSLFAVAGYLAGDLSGRGYDVSPDGSRFLMVLGSASATPIVAIHGFFDRLTYDASRRR